MMDVSGVGFPSKVPWKKMSAEELENQYCPSRWVVRLGAEEALRTYSQIGIEGTSLGVVRAPVVPSTLETEAGEWLEPRRWSLQ
uniref:Arylformamidase n=1 Tax=Pan troglodytes TaxID=9598 RepID=A0A2I3SLY5_PANTR